MLFVQEWSRDAAKSELAKIQTGQASPVGSKRIAMYLQPGFRGGSDGKPTISDVGAESFTTSKTTSPLIKIK